MAVHNWVQKADLQPADGENLDRVAVDQKAIRINDEQYWLYAAVDPDEQNPSLTAVSDVYDSDRTRISH